jgi:hypothetical protein
VRTEHQTLPELAGERRTKALEAECRDIRQTRSIDLPTDEERDTLIVADLLRPVTEQVLYVPPDTESLTSETLCVDAYVHSADGEINGLL